VSGRDLRQSGAVLLGVMVFILSGWAEVEAAKKCFDCHKKEKAEYSSKKTVHKPIQDENCESCHKRHGFAQQLILQDVTSDLCYSCHSDLKEKYSQGSVHFPVAEGRCWDCHDPHASDKAALLRQGPEGADDPGSCLICHQADVGGLLGAAHPHEPFEKLDCTGCHAAHNSPYEGLLTAPAAEVCFSCHKEGSKALLAAHEGRHTASLACVDCHTGHSSADKGLLSDKTHAPFADGDCETCHSFPDAEGNVRFEEGVSPGGLCAACHDDIVELTKAEHSHPAVEEANCVDCHDAHSARFGKLLKKRAADMCAECHDPVLTSSGMTPHMPVVLGECTKCHQVHGSDHAALMPSGEIESVCLSCHTDFAARRDSASTHHAAASDCLYCHNPHEGQGAAILAKEPAQLCVDCHQVGEEALKAASAHQPYLTGNCAGCHQPHFSNTEHLVRPDRNERCLACHADIQKRLEMPNAHAAAEEDCLGCHKPHYSDRQFLQTDHQKKLCAECHDYGDLDMTRAFVHTPAAEGDCTGCHNPHGSVREKLVTGRLYKTVINGVPVGRVPRLTDKTSDLCYTCHENLMEEFRQENTHAPVLEGQCDACHVSHGSDYAGFVKAAPAELCGACHDINAELTASHSGYNLDGANCLDCHDPHVGEGTNHMRAKRHAPFADGGCETCHEAGADGKVVLNAEISELCAACHDQVSDEMGLAHVHAPFEAGECVICHSPHASGNDYLLNRAEPTVCLDCHDDHKALMKATVKHPPFADGRCTDCHRPHASPYPSLADKPAESLCLSCHERLKKEIEGGAAHEPAAAGDCGACHEAHGGEVAGLLKKTRADLCAGCHDLADPQTIRAHSNFDVAQSNCLSCHLAHAGTKGTRGLLLPQQHAPFAEGECASCHEAGQAQSLVAPVKTMCLECHDGFQEEMARPHLHAPLASENGCVDCHGPHVGFGAALQKKQGSQTCLTCHSGTEFKGKVKHEAAFEDCSNCHQPHSSDYKRLLDTPNILELCMTCHDDAKETHYHPMGDGVIDPRTKQALTCTGCHSAHSSNHTELLVAEKDRKLCILCHDVAKH